MLDTRIYGVECHDGHKASLTANTIAENLFSLVDVEGNQHVMLDCITDHWTNGTELPIDKAYITLKNGGRRKPQNTKGWEILLQWKDGSTTWEPLKYIKECYPVQLSEYAIKNGISILLVFDWWIPFVIRKKNWIITKIKPKYQIRTHKSGIEIPKYVEDVKRIYQSNHNTNWWDAICKEMKNV